MRHVKEILQNLNLSKHELSKVEQEVLEPVENSQKTQ